MPAGSLNVPVGALLSGGRFEQLLRQAEEEYDFVIVDIPPILPVSDGVIVAKCADAAVFCDPPINGATVSNSADEDGAHYNVKANKGIANKGVPHAVPVLGPRVSLRFKPIHQVVLRVDLPLPLLPYGFVGGVAAQFGF